MLKLNYHKLKNIKGAPNMKKYILNYLNEIEQKLNKGSLTKEEFQILKDKITYFSHERLIHLLVTLFYAIFTLSFLALAMISYLFLIPFAIGLIFLLFYIPHYFFLENAVQYLYKLYDKSLNTKPKN